MCRSGPWSEEERSSGAGLSPTPGTKIGEVFGRTGEKGTYDYDFGSTTRLSIECTDGRDGRIGSSPCVCWCAMIRCPGPAAYAASRRHSYVARTNSRAVRSCAPRTRSPIPARTRCSFLSSTHRGWASAGTRGSAVAPRPAGHAQSRSMAHHQRRRLLNLVWDPAVVCLRSPSRPIEMSLKMSLRRHWLRASEFAEENWQESRKWVENSCSQSNYSCSSVEVVEMIDVLSECDPGFEVGWEAGIRTRSRAFF